MRSAPTPAALLLALAASVALAGPGEAVLPDGLPVAYEQSPRERIWDGTVESAKQSTVSAQTSARVAEIYFDVGDLVEAGQVIVRLTDVEQRTALARAEAAAREAQARHKEAEREFRRIESMFREQTVPRARFDQARANLDAAAARLQAARSSVAAAREQLGYTVVRAPYGGIVAERHVEIGEHVAPGQPLMTGFSQRELRVNIDVPQSMIEPIRTLRKAFVYVGDRKIPAAGIRLFPIADPRSNTFRVRVKLPQEDLPLYPGMFVKVGFVVGEAQRLLIPAGAVVHRSELTAVYVIEGEEVVLRQLRIGRRYGERVEVLAGLMEGERIAIDPVAAARFIKRSPATGGSRSGRTD